MVNLIDTEVLRVMPDGQFIWADNADDMIRNGDFSQSPALPHILRALRLNAELQAENEALLAANKDCLLHFNTLKADYDKAMKPLTDEEIDAIGAEQWLQPIHAAERAFARAIEAAHGIKEHDDDRST